MQRIDTSTKFADLFGTGKHGFRDGNKGIGQAATAFNAAWFNSVQEELAGVIEGSGTALVPGTNTQLVTAIQSGKLLSAVAVNTSNAYSATLTPAITGLTNGLTLHIRAPASNTTTTPTFNAGFGGAIGIVKGNGLALVAGDIAGAGHWLMLQYDSALTKWVLLNPANGVVAPATLPVGTIIAYAGTGVLAEFLQCPVAISLSLSPTGPYAALFAAIGYAWSGGAVSGNFSPPWFTADQVPVQSGNGVVGSHTDGVVISHEHSSRNGVFAGATGSGSVGYSNYNNGASSTTNLTGGPSNLAAGQRVQFFVKY